MAGTSCLSDRTGLNRLANGRGPSFRNYAGATGKHEILDVTTGKKVAVNSLDPDDGKIHGTWRPSAPVFVDDKILLRS